MPSNYSDNYQVREEASGIIYQTYNQIEKGRALQSALEGIHKSRFIIVRTERRGA